MRLGRERDEDEMTDEMDDGMDGMEERKRRQILLYGVLLVNGKVRTLKPDNEREKRKHVPGRGECLAAWVGKGEGGGMDHGLCI